MNARKTPYSLTLVKYYHEYAMLAPLKTKLLDIKVLGGFSVSIDKQPVTKFRSAKTRALLAYLATEPDQDHTRTKLATLFWRDFPDAAAKTNLRIELSNVKKLLSAHPALEISRDAVRLRSDLATIDVGTFNKRTNAFGVLPIEAQSQQLPSLAEAIACYQGEFLAGFQLNDAPEFDGWRLHTQEQLHQQVMLALDTLQLRYAEQGDWSDLANAARRQLALVPWQESAHRNLIQALAVQGKSQAALDQYQQCCRILREELGVEPSYCTQEIAERLDNHRSAPTTVRHNLTQQMNSLVGRDEEIAHLHALLQTARLVTLLGIGGVGKSRLAQAVARKALHDFVDGVWFVPLANIEATDAAPERIALATAATMGYQLLDMQRPLAELVTYLIDKQVLLVLDNWEHLIAAADAVCAALFEHPNVHVLAT